MQRAVTIMTEQTTPEQLRAAMRQWATGVALVTVGSSEQAHGMTVNSFSSISLDPALILVSMKRSTRTHQMALEEGRFAVAILSAEQKEISDVFAGRTADTHDRFEGIATRLTPSGIPFPADTLAALDCSVEMTTDAGTHTIFIARVEHAAVSAGDAPLLYFNRSYHSIRK
jgi:flavin reductase (DIM6/NTAB) family NADH-FMN oxidoreductase RutF